MRFLFILLGLLLLSSSQLSALVGNTKHNLSAIPTQPVEIRTIKAVAETEECVFCHIPHLSRPEGRPLWNREMPTDEYTLYSSDYLRRIGYPDAMPLGTTNTEAGIISRQCLSCHDGTIAVGAVYKLRADIMGGASIAMADGVSTIPLSSSANFETNLSNHHPVAIKYDPSISKTVGAESWTAELKDPPDSPIRLYTYNGNKYVECTSCHNPHTENGMFLHVGTTATSLAVDVVNTCTSCHDKTGWGASVHQSVTQTTSAAYSDPAVEAKYGTAVIAELGCANCHMPHNAESSQYLNRKVQATTCYQGAASTIGGANCHGAGGAKDVQRIFIEKDFGHPVGDETTPELHTNLDVLYGTGETADVAGGISWDTNKHALCVDCHNPHQTQKGTHATTGDVWYGTPSINGNEVSGALTGVTGVTMNTWPTTWMQPKDIKVLKSATQEWQICFKCHSYWGIGNATWGVNTNGHASDSAEPDVQLLTDVAWEMNQNNRSGHPVIFPNSPAGRPGGYDPEKLDTVQLIDPWKTNRGNQTMYCSDCHGSDTEDQNGHVKGPHGSDLKYLLKGTNHSWPYRGPLGVDAGGVEGELYTLGDIQNGNTADLFCKNCHNVDHPHTKWTGSMAGGGRENTVCVECHVSIPHGSQISRLIGYSNFPPPYNYNGLLKMTGWKKKVYNVNDVGTRTNAYAPACGGGNMCHNDFTAGYYDDLTVVP